MISFNEMSSGMLVMVGQSDNVLVIISNDPIPIDYYGGSLRPLRLCRHTYFDCITHRVFSLTWDSDKDCSENWIRIIAC